MTQKPRDITLLLQSGKVMAQEKTACAFSNYAIRYCKYEDIGTLNPKEAFLRYVPVGSVEFTRWYCYHVGIELPSLDFTLSGGLNKHCNREIRKGLFGEAKENDFVKPLHIKLFTGNIKSELDWYVPDDTEVYISQAVPFESEFRFYIQDYANKFDVVGWARYDELGVTNPEPDFTLVEDIAGEIHRNLGPSAYSIDIGWRPDLGCYSLVEINDAWSLGLYENSDPQSNPPTRQQYADMLVSRWTQIQFCNLV